MMETKYDEDSEPHKIFFTVKMSLKCAHKMIPKESHDKFCYLS